MTYDLIKHLELTQSVVTRLSGCSFQIKNWAIGVVSAALALIMSSATPWVAIVAVPPLLCFWGLDGYYLSQERAYRKLYEKVRKGESESAPYSLDATSHLGGREFIACLINRTVFPLYLALALITILAAVGRFAFVAIAKGP